VECRRLVVGTGTGALPVMKEVKAEAGAAKLIVDLVHRRGDQRDHAKARWNERNPARELLNATPLFSPADRTQQKTISWGRCLAAQRFIQRYPK
jgi:hypothetical protein